MFGGMGGMGGRNSSLRFLRLGALAALLIEQRCSTSVARTLRLIYTVVIVGVLIASFALRRRGGSGLRGRSGGGGMESGVGGGTFGAPLRPPTGYPENSDPESDRSEPYSVR